MIDNAHTILTDEEFHNTPEMKALSRKINQTIILGYRSKEGRTMNSWRNDSIDYHLKRGAVHILNVIHHQNMDLPDKDDDDKLRGLQFDNAVTRMFFASTLHDGIKKSSMKNMQEDIAE